MKSLSSFRFILVLIAVMAFSATANAAFHLWTISQIFSNADGTVQYIELTTSSGGQQFLRGHQISAAQNGVVHSFVFPGDLPGDSANRKFLIATQGFQKLGVVAPDYVVPDGFLFLPNGTVDFSGVDSLAYVSLPTNGLDALDRFGNTVVNSPTNFAGASGQVPVPQTPPLCSLTASPVVVSVGGVATLTATCNPAATSYIWTGGSCAGTPAATCTVTPTGTTSYSVTGVNAGGTSPSSSATVSVAASPATYTVPGTLGNDVFVLTAGNSYYGGGGNDTFILSPNTLRGDVTAKIVDSEGDNLIQLVDGMTVTASTFYSDAAQLTLSTGARVQILGASKFKFQLGANALAGDTADVVTYSQFATSLGASLSSTLPASGTAGYVVPTGFTQASLPVPAVAANASTVPGTLADDVLVPSGGNNHLGGGGNDTYIISPYTLSGTVTAKIIDTEGSNVIQLVNGMTIASSSFFNNAVQLTLSNGAMVQILGASGFGYQLGVNAPAGEVVSSLGYAQFAAALGASVPAAGAAAVGGSANLVISRP